MERAGINRTANRTRQMNAYEKHMRRRRRAEFMESLPETLLGLSLIALSIAGFIGLLILAGA